MYKTKALPTAGALGSVIRAAQRLNPCLDLEVDVLAVERVAQASIDEDWTALTNVETDPRTGALTLEQTASTTLFSQLAHDATHYFADAEDGLEELALDFFIDPAAVGGGPLVFDELDLWLGRQTPSGGAPFSSAGGVYKNPWRIRIGYYDERWRFTPLGDDIALPADRVADGGGLVTLRFAQDFNRLITFEPATQRTSTGAGRTSAGLLRVADVDANGISHVVAARGLSIAIAPAGRNFQYAWIGCASASPFDPTTFWRAAPNRNMGPYDPAFRTYAPTDASRNPDDVLGTGAVPGYGAKPVASGHVGLARRILTPQRAQRNTPWLVPYHALRVRRYAAAGTAVAVLDLGAAPSLEVDVRVDAWDPPGTTAGVSLRGRNDPLDAWTAIGAVADGTVLPAPQRFRYYEVTAQLASAAGFVSPGLQAVTIAERARFATARYLGDFDSSEKVDPVTGQSEIAELQLPLFRLGPRDGRDLATRLATAYAPSRLEAHVYAVNTRDAARPRYFLNSYRLEDRDPGQGVETFTFVSGLDRLKVAVPPKVETFSFAGVVQSRTHGATLDLQREVTVTVAGTPFTAGALEGVFYRPSGQTLADGQGYAVLAGNTNHTFKIVVPGESDVPAAGAPFELHSDRFSRPEKDYGTQDLALVYADVFTAQARVPQRYRGALPAPDPSRPAGAGRLKTTSGKDGADALSVLQQLAIALGGFQAWRRGRIDFVDFYGAKDVVAVWDERHLVELKPTVGAKRRLPSIVVKYGFDVVADAFAFEATFDDPAAVEGWGRANLFDVYQVPDEVCRWVPDFAAAQALALRLLGAWKTGVRIWSAQTILCHPWLELGDAVAIHTGDYTDRALRLADDGSLAGDPVKGRVAAVGVIVGKNLWGTDFLVAVRGLDAVTAAVSGDGSLGGALDPVAAPEDFTVQRVEQRTATGGVVYLVPTFTPPATPYFRRLDYRVRTRATGGAFGPTALVTGTGSGSDKLEAAWNTDVEITPVTVSSAGATRVGDAVLVEIGGPPEATITIDDASIVRAADHVEIPYTLGADTTTVDVWLREFAADPGAVVPQDNAAGATKVTTIDRGDGRSSLVLPIAAANHYLLATFVCFTALNQRGSAPPTVKVAGSGAGSGGAPTPPPSLGTIPTPAVAVGSYNKTVGGFYVAITPAGGTPSGVLWHLEHSTDGGGFSEDDEPTTSTTPFHPHGRVPTFAGTCQLRVWGTKDGWTDSLRATGPVRNVPALGDNDPV